MKMLFGDGSFTRSFKEFAFLSNTRTCTANGLIMQLRLSGSTSCWLFPQMLLGQEYYRDEAGGVAEAQRRCEETVGRTHYKPVSCGFLEPPRNHPAISVVIGG